MITIVVAFITALVVAIAMGVIAYRRGYRHGWAACHRNYKSAFRGILKATKEALKRVKGGE